MAAEDWGAIRLRKVTIERLAREREHLMLLYARSAIPPPGASADNLSHDELVNRLLDIVDRHRKRGREQKARRRAQRRRGEQGEQG